MKIVSLTVLHYGREWLEWALRAVYPFMDEMHVFYTSHPSHGHRETRHKCPDSQEELYSIVSAFPNSRWHDVDQFWDEGPQRDHARQVCLDTEADMILVVDADEIWDPDDLDHSLGEAYDKPGIWKSRIRGNLWKGVNWVCRDELMPDRIIVPGSSEPYYLSGRGFWHFGYAVSVQCMIYKWRIHGHRDELRKDWLYLYQEWKGPQDNSECGVHPTNECDGQTGKAFWSPVPFDREELRHLIADHPYWDEELV